MSVSYSNGDSPLISVSLLPYSGCIYFSLDNATTSPVTIACFSFSQEVSIVIPCTCALSISLSIVIRSQLGVGLIMPLFSIPVRSVEFSPPVWYVCIVLFLSCIRTAYFDFFKMVKVLRHNFLHQYLGCKYALAFRQNQ